MPIKRTQNSLMAPVNESGFSQGKYEMNMPMKDELTKLERMKVLVGKSIFLAGLLLPVVSFATEKSPHPETEKSPNFLVIVVDDLGYSDLGAFGGEISTPNLDSLARSGIRFSNFHTAPACAPTRAMLLTGADNHQIGLGTMVAPTPEQAKSPGYVDYLTDNTVTIASLLQKAGYETMMVGKWHLGKRRELSPASHGFQRSYVLLQGLANNYGVDQNTDLANFNEKISSKNLRSVYRENGNLVRHPVGRHSTDVYTEKMISYLDSALDKDKPFFAYMAYTAPHWPLQAPRFYIDKYKGVYDHGPEALRSARLKRLKEIGLIEEKLVAHPMQGVTPWKELSDEERAVESRRMEVYAAMVEHMDAGVGRLIQYLKDNDAYDNTVILFLSDNGAEGQVDAGLKGDPLLAIDNSLENMGDWDSYFAYGPAWAQAATAPFRLYKAYSTEGGTRTAAFVTGAGVAAKGISHAFMHVTDVTPTLLDLADVPQPVVTKDTGIAPIRGKSWSRLLSGNADQIYGEDEAVGTELFGGRALYKGQWKIVYVQDGYYLPQNSGPGKWELFNIRKDPGETTDLSKKYPDLFKDMIEQWYSYAEETGVVVLWDERKGNTKGQ